MPLVRASPLVQNCSYDFREVFLIGLSRDLQTTCAVAGLQFPGRARTRGAAQLVEIAGPAGRSHRLTPSGKAVLAVRDSS